MYGMTVTDLVLFIPMALAGAVFLGAVPIASRISVNTFRVVGALLGALVAFALIEAMPALI
jgi:hypothetical protein